MSRKGETWQTASLELGGLCSLLFQTGHRSKRR